VTGGSFWEGVRQGVISSALNHALHEGPGDVIEWLKQFLKEWNNLRQGQKVVSSVTLNGWTVEKLANGEYNSYREVVTGTVPDVGIGKAISLVSLAAKTSSKVLLNTSKQLQAKFKHADDFGVLGNYSKANAGKFSSAINQHINSVGIQTINGTYRGQSVIHYLNPNTGLNVISNPAGQFISGWKLNPAQFQNILKHGGL
jgi:hypothetical protein